MCQPLNIEPLFPIPKLRHGNGLGAAPGGSPTHVSPGAAACCMGQAGREVVLLCPWEGRR